MKHKKLFLPILTIMTMFGLAALPAMAGHHGGGAEGKSCPVTGEMKGGCDKSGMKGDCDKGGSWGKCASDKKSGGRGSKGCEMDSSPCPITAKFCKMACWMLSNQEKLGLTEEQIAKVEALKLDVQKSSIRGMAEMKVFALEMKSRLSQETVDVEAIESMIDSGMAGMAMNAKASVKAYADLKAVLTDEQKAKIADLKKAAHGA